MFFQSAKYSNRPKECVFFCRDTSYENLDLSVLKECEEFCSILGDFTEGLDSDPRSLIILNIRRVINVLQDCGIYCAYQVAKKSSRTFLKAMEQLNIPEKQFIIFSSAYYAFQSFCSPLNDLIGKCSAYDDIQPHLSNRVVTIIQILETFHRRQSSKQHSLTALIFVERRATAISLCVIIFLLIDLHFFDFT